jgi:hypothetical protein
MKLGFTGTREGMSSDQVHVVTALVLALEPEEIHHGDCVGSDEDMHNIALNLEIPVVIHPPSKSALRANRIEGTIREPKAYLARDRDIVAETDVLLATPLGMSEKSSGGTWATINMARKDGSKTVYIVFSDGQTIIEFAKEGKVNAS